MIHVRTDNSSIPTALRERPTATAKPLPAIKAVAREEVLVHVQMEVNEGGHPTTWARVKCKLGEGWIKREHLREATTSAAPPSAARTEEPRMPAPRPAPAAPQRSPQQHQP